MPFDKRPERIFIVPLYIRCRQCLIGRMHPFDLAL
jgi:hypothetical protein